MKCHLALGPSPYVAMVWLIVLYGKREYSGSKQRELASRVMYTDGMAQAYEETGTKKKRSREDNAGDQENFMKNLIDWMWKKKRYKSGGEDKKWATAAEIPKRFRSKLGQILQFDWQKKNPYPGWVLMAVQGGSGWMCKLMKNKEACEYMRKQKR